MSVDLRGADVLVVGAGIMGVGIAQVAAQAGHVVQLFDMREGAAADGKHKLGATFDTLVGKGKDQIDLYYFGRGHTNGDAWITVTTIVEDPTYLEFGYVRSLAAAVEARFPTGQPIEAHHLGGGGLTLPRYLAETRPGTRSKVSLSAVWMSIGNFARFFSAQP